MVRAADFDPTDPKWGLVEVRVQRLTGQLEIAYPDPDDVKEQAQAQGGGGTGDEGVDGWILKAVPGSGKKYL